MIRNGSSVASARRFADSLRQAVHDAYHEHGDEVDVVHYWDMDCLYLPALGFKGFADNRQEDDDVVVGSLFSAGFLGGVALTGAHKSELFSQISFWARDEVQASDSYAEALSAFLEQQDLRALENLSESLGDAGDVVDLEGALAQLRRLDRMSFAYVESVSGPWMQRVNRLLRDPSILDLSRPGPSTDEILADPRFEAFVDGVNRHRRGGRTFSTAVDASALTAIAILNDRAKATGAKTFARFFTASSTIKRLHASEKWVQDEFSFPFTTIEGVGAAGSIWRDSYYYLLRAFFPALSPHTSAVARSPGPAVEELSELSSELHRALDSGEDQLVRMAETHVFSDGDSLSELIADLESAGMARIWLRFDISDVALGAVEGLEGIRRLASIEDSHTLVGEFFSGLEQNLRLEIGDLHLSVRIASSVSTALERVKLPEDSKGVSLSRDLGSIRWGLEPSPAEDLVLVPSERDGPHGYDVILEFFDLDRLQAGVEPAERAMAVLLGFELFHLARSLAQRIKARDLRSPRLDLMVEVAELSAAGRTTDSTLAERFERLRLKWNSLHEAEQEQLALGYGFAAFKVWERSESAVLADSSPRDDRGWASWSISVVEPMLTRYSGVRQAFALNHVVYVATCAGLEKPSIPGYAVDLANLGARYRQYRFLDTVGYRRYLLARRSLPSDGPDSPWRDEVCDSVRQGLDELRTALALAPRDREVRQHLQVVQEFAALVGCDT